MKTTPHTPSILIANGVNLDLLGRREASHYGTVTCAEIEAELNNVAPHLASLCGFAACRLTFFQSNSEHAYLEKLSELPWDGALLNPGAWTHTSLALGDRLAALQLPFVEVHLSNILAREELRARSYTASHALGVVSGLGKASYSTGFYALLAKLAEARHFTP